MRNLYQKGLSLFAIVGLSSGLAGFYQTIPASAASYTTQTYTCLVPLTRMDWETGPNTNPPLDDCGLRKFDPALGKLESVTINVASYNENIWQVENLNSQARTITVNIQDLKISIFKPDRTTSLLALDLPVVSQTNSFPAFDGTLDFNGPSGNTHDSSTIDSNEETVYQRLTTNATDTQTYTDATNLNLFTASTPGSVQFVDLPVKADGVWTCGGSSNSGCVVQSFASASASVSYTYKAQNVAVDIQPPSMLTAGTSDTIDITISNLDIEATPGATTATFTLPDGIDFGSINIPGWTTTINGDTVTLVRSTPLAIGETETLTIPIIVSESVTNTGTVEFDSTARGTITDYQPVNNADQERAPVNHRPTAQDKTLPEVDDEVTSVPLDDAFVGTDQDQNDQVETYVIETIPDASQGTLMIGNTSVTPGQEIPADQIDDLVFIPTDNYTGPVTITFQTKDTFDAVSSDIGTVTFNIVNQPAPQEPGENQQEPGEVAGVIEDLVRTGGFGIGN